MKTTLSPEEKLSNLIWSQGGGMCPQTRAPRLPAVPQSAPRKKQQRPHHSPIAQSNRKKGCSHLPGMRLRVFAISCRRPDTIQANPKAKTNRRTKTSGGFAAMNMPEWVELQRLSRIKVGASESDLEKHQELLAMTRQEPGCPDGFDGDCECESCQSEELNQEW